jgi:hypothetical protein
MRKSFLASMLGLLAALAVTAVASADVKITDRPYVRHDGGTDVTIASCSSDVTDPAQDAATPTPPDDEGGGERQQNEPAAAVDPINPIRMTAGSNDYCAVPTTTDASTTRRTAARTGRTACCLATRRTTRSKGRTARSRRSTAS